MGAAMHASSLPGALLETGATVGCYALGALHILLAQTDTADRGI